ncbi:histidinol dehydrogenase [Aquirufa sp.]|jgi:histidinol dehydrogenase|uniref:histidinol dehydrogenase n=1 Tax=Aquirufa sp. TaxID=2676249 RepID=UPI0037C0C1BF
MFSILKYPSKSNYKLICERPSLDSDSLDTLIKDVFDQVKLTGDEALKSLTLQFDKKQLEQLQYTQREINELANLVPNELKEAIQVAYHNIYKFHDSQKLVEKRIETSPGVICWQKSTAIERVGIYIPGGTAPLFSTILMLAIPAKIAGCKEIVLCTPGDHPALFYAAQLCGVTQMFKLGGAQAIAAMALGTQSVPAVYKIFGPGNQYVTAAKLYANRLGIAIDMPAGPSEVAIFANETSNPAYIASDLLSQAEHGHDSQVVLVSTSENMLNQSIQAVISQLNTLPRKDFAESSLKNSQFILTESTAEAIELLNEYGAEHLILACDDAEEMANSITNAGSIFLGHYTPESAGDYASGTNHTLPTNGFAKAYSGVNLDSFVKKITLQAISKAGLEYIGPSVITMAEAESLQAHANAVKIRLT